MVGLGIAAVIDAMKYLRSWGYSLPPDAAGLSVWTVPATLAYTTLSLLQAQQILNQCGHFLRAQTDAAVSGLVDGRPFRHAIAWFDIIGVVEPSSQIFPVQVQNTRPESVLAAQPGKVGTYDTGCARHALNGVADRAATGAKVHKDLLALLGLG